MISPKHCPHCAKRIPWRKRLKQKCPFCFKAYRRRSNIQDRGTVALFLEDRGTAFWFGGFLVIFILLAIILSLTGHPMLLRFIDAHPVWFTLSIFWAGMYFGIIGRMFVPLLLNAPKILRRERAAIRQYKLLTGIGVIVGIPFALFLVGPQYAFERLPFFMFLMFIPVTLIWAYQALALTEQEYEDDRVFTYLQEIGVHDRLEHRHYAYMVLIGLPLCALLFYYFITHPWLARAIKGSAESGLIAMLLDLWRRTTGRG